MHKLRFYDWFWIVKQLNLSRDLIKFILNLSRSVWVMNLRVILLLGTLLSLGTAGHGVPIHVESMNSNSKLVLQYASVENYICKGNGCLTISFSMNCQKIIWLMIAISTVAVLYSRYSFCEHANGKNDGSQCSLQKNNHYTCQQYHTEERRLIKNSHLSPQAQQQFSIGRNMQETIGMYQYKISKIQHVPYSLVTLLCISIIVQGVGLLWKYYFACRVWWWLYMYFSNCQLQLC